MCENSYRRNTTEPPRGWQFRLSMGSLLWKPKRRTMITGSCHPKVHCKHYLRFGCDGTNRSVSRCCPVDVDIGKRIAVGALQHVVIMTLRSECPLATRIFLGQDYE